jgi:hypothetical protein
LLLPLLSKLVVVSLGVEVVVLFPRLSETMFVMLNRKPFSSPLAALPDYVRELACPSQFATRRHLLICRIYSLLCSLLPPVLVRFRSGNRCMWGCLFPLTAGGFVLPFLDPSCSSASLMLLGPRRLHALYRYPSRSLHWFADVPIRSLRFSLLYVLRDVLFVRSWCGAIE